MKIETLYENLLRRFKKDSKPSGTIVDGSSVYDTLISSLKEMERKCVGRVIVSLYKAEPDASVRGRWINAEETRYYPFETLTGDEQEMILNKKTYKVIALVTEGNGNPVSYDGCGVEIRHRTRVRPLLSRLLPESELNYVTNIGAYTGEQIKEIAQVGAESGWTRDSIERAFNSGLQQYREKTRDLMEEAGVYKSLQRMEQRNKSSLDEILDSVREQNGKS